MLAFVPVSNNLASHIAMFSSDRGECPKQDCLAFGGDQVTDTQYSRPFRTSVAPCRKQFRIHAVVYHRRVIRFHASVEHLLPDVLTHTNDSTRRTVDHLRCAATPLSWAAAHLNIRV